MKFQRSPWVSQPIAKPLPQKLPDFFSQTLPPSYEGLQADAADLAAAAGHSTKMLLDTYAKPTGRLKMPSWQTA